MNADEIVRELRTAAAKWEAKNKFIGTGELRVHDALNDAADLIESLQAQLSAKEAINQAYSATVSLLETDKAELVEQLSVSQAREQAAVKDIEKMMRICEKGSCHFCANGDCTESPYCSPKWRGPVAGEGDNNGNVC